MTYLTPNTVLQFGAKEYRDTDSGCYLWPGDMDVRATGNLDRVCITVPRDWTFTAINIDFEDKGDSDLVEFFLEVDGVPTSLSGQVAGNDEHRFVTGNVQVAAGSKIAIAAEKVGATMPELGYVRCQLVSHLRNVT